MAKKDRFLKLNVLTSTIETYNLVMVADDLQIFQDLYDDKKYNNKTSEVYSF